MERYSDALPLAHTHATSIEESGEKMDLEEASDRLGSLNGSIEKLVLLKGMQRFLDGVSNMEESVE